MEYILHPLKHLFVTLVRMDSTVRTASRPSVVRLDPTVRLALERVFLHVHLVHTATQQDFGAQVNACHVMAECIVAHFDSKRLKDRVLQDTTAKAV